MSYPEVAIPAALDTPNTPRRITPDDIEANIVSEHYFIASDAAQGERSVHVSENGWFLGAMQTLTICVLQLRNGYTVTGESNCVDPSIFDAELGRRYARAKAVDKMWALMGYALKEQLFERDLSENADILA